MATVNANLYVRYQGGDPLDSTHNRLLYGTLGGTPAIPALNAGDTLALQVFYLYDGSGAFPFLGERFAGSTTTVRLRAVGDSTIYATGDSSSEIAPAATAPTVTRTQSGGGIEEIQRIQFPSVPFTGYFTLTFDGPGGNSQKVGPKGTVTLPWNCSIADVQAAIRALPFYNYNPSTPIPVTGDFSVYLFVTGSDLTDFSIKFQQGSPNKGPIPLTVVNASNIHYAFGWNVSVPLTNGSFTDLFLTANAPAYLEVLINGSYAAQFQLTSTDGSGPGSVGTAGTPPIPPPSSSAGIIYDGDHTAPYGWPIAVLKTEHPFEEALDVIVYRQPWRALRTVRQIWELDAACPRDSSAGIVGIGPDQDVGGADLVNFELIWAQVPPTLVDYEEINYVWQITGTIGGQAAIASYPLNRTATRTRTFIRTTAPQLISLSRLPRAVVFGGGFTLFDGYVNLAYGTTTIARDDLLTRWMGNIWMKTHWEIKI
jgi:hypothetical protein